MYRVAAQRLRSFSTLVTNTMRVNSPTTPYRALVLGGSYAGLSAALNITDLCDCRPARCGRGDEPPTTEKISVDVTIVDERDGYCMAAPELTSDGY